MAIFFKLQRLIVIVRPEQEKMQKKTSKEQALLWFKSMKDTFSYFRYLHLLIVPGNEEVPA